MIDQITQLIPDSYTAGQWLTLCVCAMLITISKTGIPGIGIMAVPLLAAVLAAKQSTGLLLPALSSSARGFSVNPNPAVKYSLVKELF